MGPGLEHGFSRVRGLRLHHVSAGRGRPILFLHGFPEFWYAWRHQVRELSAGHRAVAVDMRGYNLSSKPARVDAYAMRELVDDVVALADRLGFGRFTLVGHDWGGAVAWAVARAYPERLERLVAVNAPHPSVFRRELRESAAQRRVSAYILLFQLPGAERLLAAGGHALLRRAVLRPGLARGYFTDEDRRAYLEAWSRPGALKAGLDYYRAAVRASWRARRRRRARKPAGGAEPAPALEVPTLVVWGERDRYLLPGNLRGLERHVRRLTVRRVPDAGHWIVHERPGLVTAAIRDFMGAEADRG